jgi:hypothetical protein
MVEYVWVKDEMTGFDAIKGHDMVEGVCGG